MMLGIGKEAVIFVYAGLSGIVTFSCYQILLLLRKLVPHSAAAVSAEDFFYWIESAPICSGRCIIQLMGVSDGSSY